MGKFADGNCTVDGEADRPGIWRVSLAGDPQVSMVVWIQSHGHPWLGFGGTLMDWKPPYEYVLRAVSKSLCKNATSQRPHQIRWFVWGIVPKMPLNLASHLLPTGNLDYQITIFGSFKQLIPKFSLIPMCLISPSTFDAFDQGQVTDWAVGDRNSLFLGEMRGVDRPRTCQTPQGHLSLMISWYVELYS